ncbi:hypothetical protein WCX18_09660 [Sulfurimonas sp. HSL1-2]|uniref:hypothetical protein n=1 Tax=Thiomicrolovo zhangzhouensis TaxID=3131933 RepID=UPI0031F8B8C3
MTQEHQALKTEQYLNPAEITAHLEGVEYIVMAAPAVRDTAKAPIHFTLFLNTADNLPADIQQAVLDKFADQYGFRNIADLFSQPDRVAFAVTTQETPMPLHLFKPEDKMRLPSTVMFVMDFEADSDNFPEVKEKQLTGWTYAYETE